MATSSSTGYQLLVANFSRPYPSEIFGADPANQSYTRTRTGFRFRHIQNIGFSSRLTNGTSVRAASVITKVTNAQFNPFPPEDAPTGDVTVASDVFSGGSASLFVGPFELIAGRDFGTGGGVAVTATNIAAAVDNLPGYTGVAVGPVVTVTGPRGQVGLRLNAIYRGGEQNFTFVYTAEIGVLGTTLATSPIRPPIILPAGLPNGVAP